MQQVSYGPLIMCIMLIMSCYTGFFNVWRGWQSLNTGPRFYLRLIRRTGWLWIYASRTTDGRPFKPKKLSVPFRMLLVTYKFLISTATGSTIHILFKYNSICRNSRLINVAPVITKMYHLITWWVKSIEAWSAVGNPQWEKSYLHSCLCSENI